MAKEIERKFLVTDTSFVGMATERHIIRQGYLSTEPDSTVRVRLKDDMAYITIKTRNVGAVRNEWEYAIPASDAADILSQCHCPSLAKVRHIVPYGGHVWEVDVFEGALAGLILAEVELSDAAEPVALPPFVGREVTDDPTYYNSVLIGATAERR